MKDWIEHMRRRRVSLCHFCDRERPGQVRKRGVWPRVAVEMPDGHVKEVYGQTLVEYRMCDECWRDSTAQHVEVKFRRLTSPCRFCAAYRAQRNRDRFESAYGGDG